MEAIKKVVKLILIGFVPFMLIVYLVRLSNNKMSDFIGLSNLYYYFQSVNIWKPFQDMFDSLSSQYNQFVLSSQNFQNVSDLWEFLSLIPQWLGSLLTFFMSPTA